MVKKRQQLIKQLEKIQTRKTRQLTKRLSQEIKDSQTCLKHVESLQSAQRKQLFNETKQKTQNPNQDIDIYFDSCISPTYSIQPNPCQETDKIPQHNTLYLNQKPPVIPEIKYEFAQENQGQSEQFVQRIEQKNEENESQNSNYGNQSPIFGRKTEKINQTYTSSYKHEEFKIYDHSQENIGRDLMDQLDDGSKVSVVSEKESVSQQISSEHSTRRFASRITNRKRKNQTLSKRPINSFLSFEETQNHQSHLYHHETVPQVRRRAQMLRISSLADAKENYDRSLQELNKTWNFLKNVMYYYEVRESHQKVYSFRSNIFQVLNDELRKLKNVLALKREVCCETIKKKAKKGHIKMWRYELEKGDIFDSMADNLMK